MNRYTVETSPRPNFPGAIEQTTLGKAAGFHSDYLAAHPEKATDPKIQLLFGDLKAGAFWRVIDAIDGRNKEPILGNLVGTDGYYDPERTARAQAWSHENFNPQELQTVVDIVVDTALLVPRNTPWPGTYKGHTILFSEFVAKPDSQFKDHVSDDFRRRLNNGRFWENIPDMKSFINGGVGIIRVEDVLANYHTDLNTSFALEGLTILKRGEEAYGPNFSLDGLSVKAIDRYASFIFDLSKKREEIGITREHLDILVAAYADIVVSTIGEFGDPRYPLDRNRNFAVRLQDPRMQEYLKGSDLVRDRIAHSLELMSKYGNKGHASQVFDYVPNPKDMKVRMGNSSLRPV